jgi:hypothetical protein
LEANTQENLSTNSTENTQIEAVSEGLLEQSHQANRHKVLICDIQQESLNEMLKELGGESNGKTTKGSSIHPPPIPKEKGLENTTRKTPRNGFENHQKGKMG